MGFVNKVALILVIAGALFVVFRNGGEEAINGNANVAWEENNDVDPTFVSDARRTVNDSLSETMSYAENAGEDVSEIAE